MHPGDSLWAIVSARERGDVPPGIAPPAGLVAHLVGQVHHDNRSVIGPDPDHIEPGQRLQVPWPTPETTPEANPETTPDPTHPHSPHPSKEQP